MSSAENVNFGEVCFKNRGNAGDSDNFGSSIQGVTVAFSIKLRREIKFEVCMINDYLF